MIASDCAGAATIIIRGESPKEKALVQAENEDLELKHYRFKNIIWNKILSTHDFEQFDEFEYFRLLEIYKDGNGTHKDLLSMNPVSIEQKLALIEAIQMKFTRLNNLPSIQDEIENLNDYKLKKLHSLMKGLDLSKKITRADLEKFSSDFFLILKSPPLSLLDYFSANKTQQMNERMFLVLQEDMLIRGLRGELERIPEKENIARLEKAHAFIKKVIKNKLWRTMVLPSDLAWVDRIKISDELLENIFMDGLDAHESELIIELKNQNAIEQYERFRQVYRPVAFGIGFYHYYQKYHNVLEANEMSDVKKLSESILFP